MQIPHQPVSSTDVDNRLAVARTRIRQLREAQGLSQAAAGKLAGVDQPTWCRLERGDQELTLGYALRVQHALGLPTVELLLGSMPSCITAPEASKVNETT